jgi:23S rRNA pseudouridine1911/1915/1917 synthase
VAHFARPEELAPRPEPAAPLVILARGPGWLAVDKPAGVPVHPLDPEELGTIANALVARHPEAVGVGEGGLRSGVVHRLDVDTSGVLLCATREAEWQRLRAAFRSRRVAKVYLALVRGRMARAGDAELRLVTARHRPARVRVAAPDESPRGARPVSMRWRPLAACDAATLVEVRPETGFLHQIRVVLAHFGFPILGDGAYADPATAAAAPRQMLHAARVAVDEIDAVSPEPADFAAVRERLGLTAAAGA